MSSALIITLIATLLAFTLVWAVHVPLKNAGVVDFYWGPGFVVIALIYAVMTPDLTSMQWALIAYVSFWAVRLTISLSKRYLAHKVEDARYTVMRINNPDKFWITSLPKVFWLQAVILWAIAAPLHTALSAPATGFILGPVWSIGFALVIAGLWIETTADRQLATFKRHNPDQNTLLDDGLWRYSRHPNYFGEALFWWGIGLIAFAFSNSIWSFAGPILLTIILVGVTGNLTDKHMSRSRGELFDDYKARTSPLIPMSPALYMRLKGQTGSSTQSPAE